MTASPEPYADRTSETPQVWVQPVQQARPAGRAWSRARDRAGEMDLRNTWQIIAGAVLLPLGIAIIILGWHGAAYGNVDQKQIPYLISGGVLGLAIVLIGCFFYWAHWLYRIYDQADLHHQEAMREQTEMMKAVLDALQQRPGFVVNGTGAATGAAARAAVSAAAAAPSAAAVTYLATPTGTNFHVAGCSMIANRLGTVRTVPAEEAEKMRPCRICEPLHSE